ncbi:hypothetical protein BD413DRAFT_273931 [Trametes elegans]|nr:hypothetical protein BD413DRAFT_273931 [Trametes elegans]
MVIYARNDLCDHGIINRDISAGNILIRIHADVRTSTEREKDRGDPVDTWSDIDETEGFLTDFETAELRVCRGLYSKLWSYATMRRRRLLTDTADQEPTGFNPPATTGSTPMQGDAITRTAIFMATKLLMEIAKAQAKNLSTAHIFRGREYGVESFYWVIIHVMSSARSITPGQFRSSPSREGSALAIRRAKIDAWGSAPWCAVSSRTKTRSTVC